MGRKRREPHSVESADGTRIGYTVSGAGPSLLLVHGTAVDSRSCILLGNVLAESRRVALMDRRGRGLSQDGGTYSLAREVEDVLAVVEALDPPVHVVGISYGGLPALEAAARSDRLAAVAIFEPPIRTGEYTFLTESGMAAGRDAGPGQGAGDGPGRRRERATVPGRGRGPGHAGSDDPQAHPSRAEPSRSAARTRPARRGDPRFRAVEAVSGPASSWERRAPP